jgi:hypothetical protein
MYQKIDKLDVVKEIINITGIYSTITLEIL